MVSVPLFVPNLIGYVRLILGIAAFFFAIHNPTWFIILYTISYGLDAVDGVAARALGQQSRFGAVLDMVTDRLCSMGLLAILTIQAYDWYGIPLAFMVLDIGSHWTQMYSYVGGAGGDQWAVEHLHFTPPSTCSFLSPLCQVTASTRRVS